MFVGLLAGINEYKDIKPSVVPETAANVVILDKYFYHSSDPQYPQVICIDVYGML